MLIKSIWTLSCDANTVLPQSYCLQLTKQLHEKMGLSLGEERIPSVCFSGILGNCSGSKNYLNFYAEECYQIALCGLSEDSCKAIASLDLGNSLEFLGAKFKITGREDVFNNYEQLYTLIVGEDPKPTRNFKLNFHSATAFYQNSLHLPLPVPNLMFRGWLEKWNNFSTIYLGGDELIEYLNEGVKIKKHKLQSRSFQLERGYITGFTGEVTLQVPARFEPLLANVTHLLACYAAWCGTGVKTRLGMGFTSFESDL